MAGLFQFFRHCYVINLPSRQDRRKQAKRELAKCGATPTFFSAIKPNEAAGFESVGARGCFLSHLAVIRAARDRKLDRILILEDDFKLEPDFAVREAREAVRLQSQPWDIFYGGSQLSLSVIPYDQGVLLTHMVGFNGRILGDIVEYLEAMLTRPSGDPAGGPMHLDGAYSWFRASRPDVVTLAAVPPLATQRSSRSDIHPHWIDGVPLISTAVTALRKFKG